MSTPVEPEPSQSDEAARAGWMYYVGGMTQDHIARELGVSRQRAQRLVSRAMAEGLIHVRLNHRIASCLALEKALTERFSLLRCRVVPSLGAGADPVDSIAPAAAAELERFLRLPDPLVIALGTGRALRAMVDSVAPLEAEHHRLVSLIGNIAPDGSSSFFEVIMRLADKVRAPHYPMPVPVVMVGGFLWLAMAPTFAVLAIVMVTRRAGEYALARPGREMLFTVVAPSAKYKAKNVIDTAVYRGADAVSGWVKAGIDAIASSPAVVGVLGAVVALAWAGTGFGLARAQGRREAAATAPAGLPG